MQFRLALFAALLVCAIEAAAVTIDTVPVGNLHNVHDATSYGRVDYAYRIGTTEVTNAQYTEFLNAKATSDPLNLYSTKMGSDARGGITRSGPSGSFTYATKPDMANKPVNFVNWYDSIRFTNWLNNGQGTSTTEVGAYTLLGNTAIPSNALNITRSPLGSGPVTGVPVIWFLPSENEWYKAAYHQPFSQGGPAGDYWDYATRTQFSLSPLTEPTIATANGMGDISNPGANVANYSNGADWNGQNGNVTTVGSAGPLSASYYGTFDQSGNVGEWTEGFFNSAPLRGGWFAIPGLRRTARPSINHEVEEVYTGFRVATIPEPSTIGLAAFGLAALVGVSFRRARFGAP